MGRIRARVKPRRSRRGFSADSLPPRPSARGAWRVGLVLTRTHLRAVRPRCQGEAAARSGPPSGMAPATARWGVGGGRAAARPPPAQDRLLKGREGGGQQDLVGLGEQRVTAPRRRPDTLL